MPSWGLQGWGDDHWSLETLTADAAGTDLPVITLLRPVDGSTTVPVTSTVALSFIDVNSDLDLTSIQISIDGVDVYSSVRGFQNGYTGSILTIPQGVLIEFIPVEQWNYDQVVNLSAQCTDVQEIPVSEDFSWQFEANPRCYTGLSPLPIEGTLQQEFSQFIVAERVRKTLFDAVIKNSDTHIREYGAKAARCILQVAYSTELRTLLNRRLTLPSGVLDVTVCERDRDIHVDKALELYVKDVRQLIDLLRAAGELPQYYVATLNDYLDSNRYQYRVSAIATLIVLAKTIEG